MSVSLSWALQRQLKFLFGPINIPLFIFLKLAFFYCFDEEMAEDVWEILFLFERPKESLWGCTFLAQQKPTRSDQNRQVHNFVRS
jgi:hypothetical protein